MSGIRALDSSGARAPPAQDASPPKRAASRAEDEDDDGDFDESLGALLNPAKVRSKTTKDLEVEAEQPGDESDSSDPNLQRQMEYIIAAQRNKAVKDQPRRRKVPINAEPPPPPPQGGKKKKPSKSPSISSSSSSPQTQSSSGASGEEPSEEEDDEEEDEPEEETRLERKIRKACEKAKLLARIDQLHESHHIPKTREFTYRASTEELTVEVARMEVLQARGVRVKQGRAAFLYSVMGIEKAMNFSDKQEVLPFNWYMGGFTKEATRSIADYDDALESAVEDLVGPGGRMPWYMQLGFILVPAMAQHSMMQRFKDDPEHTARVLREDPALANRVAEEIARTEIRRRELAAAEAPPPAAPPAAPPTRTVAGARPRVQMQPAARGAAPALDNRPVPPPLATREETAHMHLTVEAAEQMAKQRAQLQAQEGRMQALERQLAETQERARADRARADAAAAASAALHAEVARAKQATAPAAPAAAPVVVPAVGVGGIAAALAASRAARAAAADDSSSASSSGLDIFVQ